MRLVVAPWGLAWLVMVCVIGGRGRAYIDTTTEVTARQ